MSYNEAETRFYLIDPVLRGKGYNEHWKLKLETPAPVEPTGAKGRRHPGAGRTDYLLCVHVGAMPKPLPVAVIEAKAETEDPLKGMQQAKEYADCKRFQVQYVFATNGHRYGEFDITNQMPDGPFPFADFPTHDDLTARYAKDSGIDVTTPQAAMLFMSDSAAFPKTRYYQDAAIRAAFEKILQCEQRGEPARVLLSLATGSGKTVIAASLLWRMHEAGRLTKPALFLCDRDELREQAYDKLAKAFPKGSVRIVKSERGTNAAKNAKVHVATYQTLGLDDTDHNYASFLSEHYTPDSFSVIVIDECHRSAWGQWSEVLKRNPSAIHIGLTATPRKLHESQQRTQEDVEITSKQDGHEDKPFPTFARLISQRGTSEAESDYSWTVDFTARRAKAHDDMAPHLAEVEKRINEAVALKDKIATLKRAKASEANIESCRVELARVEKAQREAKAKADAIDAATFDLKAVNPRARVIRDTRSVGEILESIERHGQTVQEALGMLRKQLVEEKCDFIQQRN